MQKNSVADVLRALATGNKARSETARLRDVVDSVESALSAGVSRAAVLEALHGQGFTMTLKSFESALYRIRKQREKAGQKTTQPPPLANNSTEREDNKTPTPQPAARPEDKLKKQPGFDPEKLKRDDKDLF